MEKISKEIEEKLNTLEQLSIHIFNYHKALANMEIAGKKDSKEYQLALGLLKFMVDEENEIYDYFRKNNDEAKTLADFLDTKYGYNPDAIVTSKLSDDKDIILFRIFDRIRACADYNYEYFKLDTSYYAGSLYDQEEDEDALFSGDVDSNNINENNGTEVTADEQGHVFSDDEQESEFSYDDISDSDLSEEEMEDDAKIAAKIEMIMGMIDASSLEQKRFFMDSWINERAMLNVNAISLLDSKEANNNPDFVRYKYKLSFMVPMLEQLYINNGFTPINYVLYDHVTEHDSLVTDSYIDSVHQYIANVEIKYLLETILYSFSDEYMLDSDLELSILLAKLLSCLTLINSKKAVDAMRDIYNSIIARKDYLELHKQDEQIRKLVQNVFDSWETSYKNAHRKNNNINPIGLS